MKRVRRIVSELKKCGEKIKDEDVAYTILLGLGEKYSPLVVTLTNMAIPEHPLSIARVSKQILTEEQRLNQFNSPQQKPDQNINNPLAYKQDTLFKGDLPHAAFVARMNTGSYRQNPYPQRGVFQGRGGYLFGGPAGTRFGSSQATSTIVQQMIKPQEPGAPDTTHTWSQHQRMWAYAPWQYRNLPWAKAPCIKVWS